MPNSTSASPSAHCVKIVPHAFDPWHELQHYQSRFLHQGQFGATATFVGTMRDFNEGDGVTGMTLEHYPGMTEASMAEIVATAAERWELLGAHVVHRVGRLLPGEQIVLVLVASPHRADAFAACEFIMDYLKTDAVLWKREDYQGEARWLHSAEGDKVRRAGWE